MNPLGSCDVNLLTFDISSTAGLYSQIAGLLAGFAFAGIIFMVEKDSEPSRGDDLAEKEVKRTQTPLLVGQIIAFLVLVIATILYATIGGERGCALLEGRTASEEFLASTTFALGVLTLLYSIVTMLGRYRFSEAGRHARRIVAVAAAPLVIMFLSIAAQDVAHTPWLRAATSVGRKGGAPGAYVQNNSEWAATFGWMSYLGLLAPLAVVTMIILKTRIRSAAWVDGLIKKPIAVYVFPYLCLALALATATRSTLLSPEDVNARLDEREVFVWLIMTTAAVLAQAIFLILDDGILENSHQSEALVGLPLS